MNTKTKNNIGARINLLVKLTFVLIIYLYSFLFVVESLLTHGETKFTVFVLIICALIELGLLRYIANELSKQFEIDNGKKVKNV